MTAAELEVVVAEEEEVAVVVDITAHLALTRSASPTRHPRLAGEGR